MAGYYIIALAIVLFSGNIDAATKVTGKGETADTFTLKITNTARQPTFSASTLVSVVGEPLIRYMEEAVLLKPLEFKSFTVNFTSPYGYLVTSINGVQDTYYVDRYYWDLAVNGKGAAVGVSFYVPQANDVIELAFKQSPKN